MEIVHTTPKIQIFREQATMEKTMKLLKYLLPFALATCGVAAMLSAQDVTDGYSTTLEARERDPESVKDFINLKRGVNLGEKGGSLVISGDVRSDWDHVRTFRKGRSVRGKRSANLQPPKRPHAPFTTNEFDIEVNLRLDYKGDRTWATAQWQFLDPAGIPEKPEWKKEENERITSKRHTMFGSGKLNNVVLRKAYMGWNAYEEGTSRFDIELGRRRLYDVFESEIQFKNFFDGLLLKYVTSFEGMTDFTLKLAAFVVDFSVNHFGEIGEVGLLNIADSGLDFTYSLIDWHKDGVNRYHKKHGEGRQFINSQFILAYNFSDMMMSLPKSRLYAAYLHNHAARESHISNHKKANEAYYVGFKMGEVKKRHDWAFDVRYEWVQAQAVPEQDASGIGRDNPQNVSFGLRRWGGYANYKGYIIDTYYALTDNLTFNIIFNRVHQCQRAIGGKLRSYQFDIEAIYAF